MSRMSFSDSSQHRTSIPSPLSRPRPQSGANPPGRSPSPVAGWAGSPAHSQGRPQSGANPPGRSPSPPRRDAPHEGDPTGAQPPRFPYQVRPLTAGPRTRVPQRPFSAMNRPASALLQQRPGTAQMRRRLSLSATHEQAHGLSPWSDVSSHGDRGGQEPFSQNLHSRRPTTAKKSPALARYLDEDMYSSLAPGPRREFRPPPDGSVSYPLGTSPVNSKVNKIERVRTENGWLREEVEKLRMQLAAETQMHQYRAHAATQEKQALQAKLVQAEQATAAALKKVSDGSGRVKRREGMVHQVRHEEARRRLIRERVIRRLLHDELHGAKEKKVLSDWTLFHAGIGDYFRCWRQVLQKHGNASEGEQDASATDEGNWTSTDDEARCAMACSPRSVQRRDISKRIRRLDRQKKHLIRREQSISPGSVPFMSSIGETGLEGDVAMENTPAGRGGEGGAGASGPAAPLGLEEDGLRQRREVGEADSREEETPRVRGRETEEERNARQQEKRATLRKQLSSMYRSSIPGAQDPAAEKLTEREEHFLEVAVAEILKRKKLEWAWQEERIEIRESRRQITIHLKAAFEHLTILREQKDIAVVP